MIWHFNIKDNVTYIQTTLIGTYSSFIIFYIHEIRRTCLRSKRYCTLQCECSINIPFAILLTQKLNPYERVPF